MPVLRRSVSRIANLPESNTGGGCPHRKLKTLVDIDESDLKNSLLGLVVALVEIIAESLRSQAVWRMEAASLNEAEVERLGEALMDLSEAVETIKLNLGVTESVRSIRSVFDKSIAKSLGQVWESPEYLHCELGSVDEVH